MVLVLAALGSKSRDADLVNAVLPAVVQPAEVAVAAVAVTFALAMVAQQQNHDAWRAAELASWLAAAHLRRAAEHVHQRLQAARLCAAVCLSAHCAAWVMPAPVAPAVQPARVAAAPEPAALAVTHCSLPFVAAAASRQTVGCRLRCLTAQSSGSQDLAQRQRSVRLR